MADLFEHSRTTAPARGIELNPEQQAAAQHGEGPLVVVAGAGTGKTRVITERIRYLLESQPELTGEEILGLTFTDKAAAEMKHRVVASAGERGKAVTLSTFHSFCNALLLEVRPELKPVDKVDHWILLRRNLAQLQLEQFRHISEPGQFLSDFIEFFSRCQDELVTPDEYQRYADEQAENFRRVRAAMPEDERTIRDAEIAKLQEIARAYRASDQMVRERNLLTFGMQLLDAVARLRNDAALREKLRARYRYLLVDEFQDTNIAQLELLWLLGGERPNLVVVGDHRQAIYRFRGASFGSFTIFLKRFAGGSPSAHSELLRPLTLNYRSAGRILRVAGQAIRHNEKPANIPEYPLTAVRDDGEKVRIVTHPSTAAEAQWVGGEIERLHRAGARWRSFAVLYRSHAHRDKLVETLKARKIPFVIRNLSILSHPLVRDVIAYLRLIDQPSDDVACARVLAMPAWGLGPRDLVRLAERAAKGKGRSLWDALQAAQGELPFTVTQDRFSGGERRTDELVALIGDLRKIAHRATAAELFDQLAERLEVGGAVAPDDRKYFARLAQFVREWEPKSETKRLREFVEYLEYFEQAGGSINLEQESGDAVQLMTVHAAKGLEFDHVYVLRLVQRGFPMGEKPRVLEFPPELMKEELPQGSFHIQEERRLFYVAVTRARHRLTLNTVEHKRSKPSVFLEDILMDAQIKRRDVEQLAPQPPSEIPAEAQPQAALFNPPPTRARIGSRIAEWAATYRPPVPVPLQLSPTTVGDLDSCPQKYLFSRAWRIRGGPAARMSFGSVMHNTIKYFIGALAKGRALPFEEVEKKFELEWTSAGFEDEYQEQGYKKEGLAELRAFHASTLAAPPDVLAQEKPFELPMENNVVLTGRMDQVNRIAPDEVEIVDYKTGRPRDEKKARKDAQLSAYALAAREAFDWNPARLTFYNLQNNQAVSAARDDKALNKLREEIQEAAADIRAGRFPPKLGYWCKTCEYESLCPAREQGAAATATDEE
jgi:ATP-dependent DNA helicase UvrD/PcrA